MVLALIELGILSQTQALTIPTSRSEEQAPSASLRNRFASFDTACPPEMFVGRQREISKVVHELRSTLFVGDVKTGKTNLLYQVRHALQTIPVLDCKLMAILLSPSPVLQSAGDVFASIRVKLATWLANEFAVHMQDTHHSDEVRTILTLLGECEARNRRLRLVLLVDDLDIISVGEG